MQRGENKPRIRESMLFSGIKGLKLCLQIAMAMHNFCPQKELVQTMKRSLTIDDSSTPCCTTVESERLSRHSIRNTVAIAVSSITE